MLKRAQHGVKQDVFGLSADTEKRKYGAKQIAKFAYVQALENYNMEVIESMAVLEG